jgi:hypothetical protein
MEQFLSDSSQLRNSVINGSFNIESFSFSGGMFFLSLQKVKKSLNVTAYDAMVFLLKFFCPGR